MKRAGSGKPKSRNVRVVWDPANLEYLEANKSPKQKITEPKTPYHAPEVEDGSISPIVDEGRTLLDQAVQAEDIRSALSEVASSSHHSRSRGGGWTSSEDEGDEFEPDLEGAEANRQNLSFQEHRKAHYDEYRKLKALRSSGSHDSEEEESQFHNPAYSSRDQEGSLTGDMDAFGIQETAASSENCNGKAHNS